MRYAVPFSINRRSQRSLVDQTVDGLVKAIYGGTYLSGQLLPSYRMLAERLGVSVRVPREALRRLVADGFARYRPGRGMVVASPLVRSRARRALIVLPSWMMGFFANSLAGAFGIELEDAGYFVDRTFIGRGQNGEKDYRQLESTLETPYDFVLAMDGIDEEVIGLLAARNLCYFSFHYFEAARPDRCAGRVLIDWEPAMRDLAAACRRARVRSVVQFDYHPPAFTPKGRLGNAKFRLQIAETPDEPHLEDIRLAAHRAILSAFVEGGRRFPDLFVFSDDYAADGALAALYEAGFSAPRDFRYVSLVNRGYGISFAQAMGWIVSDPVEFGRQIAAAALRVLRGECATADVTLVPRYERAK